MSRFIFKSDDWASRALAGSLLTMGLATPWPAAAQDADTPPLPTEDEPAEPIELELEPDVEALADEAIAQAALESELASARRFEVELAALLQPDGQLDTTQGDEALTKLASLATRCGILANSAMHDEVRLVLLGYQARALAALISLEPADPQQDPTRIEQLHDVAEQIGDLDLPGTEATADYWALLAAMANQAKSQASPAQQRALTEWSLSRYIDKHEADEDAAEYLLDTRLSLAQLMDQRGAQQEVLKLLEQIGKLPADSPRSQEIKRLRDSAARLGTPIQFESISTQLATWRASDHLGKPVLIHVYADQVEPSVRMIDMISRSIVEGTISGIAVVSLRIGEPIAASASPHWPTLPVQLEPKGVLDQLGVAALPTLAWLDEEGKLISIGTTAAVLDQLATITADDAEDPAEEAQDAEAIEAPEPQPEPKPELTEPEQPAEEDKEPTEQDTP